VVRGDYLTPTSAPSGGAARACDTAAVSWLFRNRHTGEITVAQAPNAALVVFLVATVVNLIFDPAGNLGTAVTIVSRGALAIWAADEILRGVNPFRRILGGVVLAGIVASLAF
jgi:hypothetical protein